MTPENRELLQRGLSELQLELPDTRLQLLIGYHDLLMQTNHQFNLTGFRNERESLIYNVLNALAPWRHVEAALATADIGSGAGLPGLPLAIALDMPAMTLVESKRKKCDFLRDAARAFAPKVRVEHGDANAMRKPVAQVVSSAFGTLAKLLGATVAMRRPGARTLAWKGRQEVIDGEIAACAPRDRQWQVIPFAVPGMTEGTQRHLCIHVTTAGRRRPAASRAPAR